MIARRPPPDVTAATRMVALIGHPVSHSASPRVHNAAFRALGMGLVYLAFSVKPEELEAAVRGLRALGALGANVTSPYKQAVLPLLDRLTDRARVIGAANTLYWDEGQLVGENTDGLGFMAAIQEQGLGLRGRRVTILGNGGAARAVAVAAAELGARAIVMTHRQASDFHPEIRFRSLDDWQDWSRSNAPGGDAAGNFFTRLLSGPPPMPFAIGLYPIASDLLERTLGRTDCLVNATPVGMWPLAEATPLAREQLALLPDGATVIDLAYNPRQTRLLRLARARGLKGHNGLGMLLHQGALSFRFWTGQPAPLDVMRRAMGRR